MDRFLVKRPVTTDAASNSEQSSHVTGDEVPMLSAEPVPIEKHGRQAEVSGVDSLPEHEAEKQQRKKT